MTPRQWMGLDPIIMNRDDYGMDLARTASFMSKDPSTKVGCCIMRPDGTIASLGYNGTVAGVDDEYWMKGPRDRKLAVTIHAEQNAVLSCRDGTLGGYTAYVWPLPCCSHCAAVLARSGVKRVVCPEPDFGPWFDSASLGKNLLEECGATVSWMPGR